MDIKGVIREQRKELEDILKKEKIIDREGLENAKSYLKRPNILIITGIRRCGKSIFSYLLERGHKFAYINFDDERLLGIKTEELNLVLQAFYELYGDIEYLIFDEIQNVKGWELFANRLRRTKKVIITGSNSSLLSGELASHITGRYLEVNLFPFSFKEFLNFKGFNFQNAYTTEEKAEILNKLKEYMEKGGFPESYSLGSPIVAKIYDNIITKDILLRYGIRKIDELKKLSRYIISNSSKEFTHNKLSNIINVERLSTISNWIYYLEETFLIFKLEKFDFKLKQQYKAPKKGYCIDTGIINSIGFKVSENIGATIETLVAIELQRRKRLNINLEIYYWKDYQQNEVDFVIKDKNKVSQLIQVSYILSKEDINEREIRSLLKGSKELRCDNLLVLTWDYEAEEKTDGKIIHYIPAWKWLIGG